ncbi:RING finger protein 37 [Habropoda laboriosa]|uniref:RING finger protein 37 n=1 Tax=Habropoda laboriosa TaxID=597456 RepID=A0A0L7RJ38_9HYME|nr:PREDICTED: RING finger protein 37 [Habropoda laboriosa]KOC70977.1 RING finger protein 37 [Habropoda laboriosa]
MFFNFCDSRLRPEIQCSTVSTEGYEVTNLINDSDKGFLAYACIKPPVNIDITFLCNICVSHILIWPQVGLQKSSGFQLYAKTSNDNSVPYSLLANGFLDSSNTGLLFYPSTVNPETISVPPNFLKRYIKPSLRYLSTYISSLRICICKTENSVPALGKIEVWGTVSPRCGKDTVASVFTLWSKQQSSIIESVEKSEVSNLPVTTTDSKETLESSLQVPECFLDAITYEIMTQPILLPSGKIIDQSTLLKHEETEALWGRRLTDPFTGLPFSEDRKPVIASALKIRIDKFLLENSNMEEIKKLPRVLGRAAPLNVTHKKVAEVPKYVLKRSMINRTVSNTKPKLPCSAVSNIQARKKVCHKLPVVVMSQKRSTSTLTNLAKRRMTASSSVPVCKEVESEKRDDSTDVVDLTDDNETEFDLNTAVPHLKRFNNIPEKNDSSPTLNSCSCCPSGTFYRLPCKHVLCRKVLTSIENNQCTTCGTPYKNSEIERFHE